MMLPRLHLFEFEDLPWFPERLRNFMTGFLSQAARMTNLFSASGVVIARMMRLSEISSIVDLASGGGGGFVPVALTLKKDFPRLKIFLTDLYPNKEASAELVNRHPDIYTFVETPVNAMHVPEYLTGIRTMFLSFHHFRYNDAKKILQDAVDRKQPIAIFEAQQRTLLHLLPMLLSPVSTLLVTPFIRPFRWERIFFTYIFPLLLITIMWDGVASVFRTYTQEEMRQMISELRGGGSFVWETGEVGKATKRILFLSGIPKISP